MFLTLGNSDEERLSTWKDMQRIVRKAVAAKQDVPSTNRLDGVLDAASSSRRMSVDSGVAKSDNIVSNIGSDPRQTGTAGNGAYPRPIGSDNTAVASAYNKHRFDGMATAVGLGDRDPTLVDDLRRLLRGESGKSGDGIVGSLVARHVAHGDVSLEEIARAAKGRVTGLRDRPFGFALGAVQMIVNEVRTADRHSGARGREEKGERT